MKRKIIYLFIFLFLGISSDLQAQFHKMFGASVGASLIQPSSSVLKPTSAIGLEAGLSGKVYFNYNIGAYFGIFGGMKRMKLPVYGYLGNPAAPDREQNFEQVYKMPYVMPEAAVILIPFTYPFYLGVGGFFDITWGAYALDGGYSDTEITFKNSGLGIDYTLKDFKKDMSRPNFGPSFYLGFRIADLEFKANYRLGMVEYKGKDNAGNKWSMKYNQFTIGLYQNFAVYGCSKRECHLH